MKYISSTLSLNMCSCDEETQLNIEPICEEQFLIETVNARSVIRNKRVANKFGVDPSNARIQLKIGDVLYVATEQKLTLKTLYDTFMGRPKLHYYKVEVGYI